MDPSILPKVLDVRDALVKHTTKKYSVRPVNRITHLTVHHSLTHSGSAESFARYHVQNNGWPGIGYHFVIEKNGQIKWCHDVTVRSYHVGNSNSKSVGICMVGDFRNSDPTSEQEHSLHRLLKWLQQELSIPVENVQGHSEFPGYEWKACPCIDMDALREALKHSSILNKPTPVDAKDPNQLGIGLSWILKKMHDKGHVVFKKDHVPYNLNIVGIRSTSREANAFDDHLAWFYKYRGVWTFKVYKATTDPGLYYLNHPANVHGTAILKEGQYRGAYQLGLHRNRYMALKQVRPVTVIRDIDRDNSLSLKSGKEQTGIFGINIHRASAHSESPLVNRWSAGCQVIADPGNFDEFIEVCKKARHQWGASFTYTLLEA